MKLRCTELTRGSGKIYLRVEWDDDAPLDLRVEASAASTRRGVELPCVVMPLEGQHACVVMLAVFSVAQRLRMRLADGRGAEHGHLSINVLAAGAKLTSQFNTFRHNQEAEAIRNLDAKERRCNVRIEVGECIYHASDDHDIVHGIVEVRGLSKEDVAGDVDLRLFDNKGVLVDDGVWTPMGDSVAVGVPGSCVVRTVAFSARVPRAPYTLAIWASVDSAADGLWSAIESLRPFEVRDRCVFWNELTLSAQVCPFYDEWFRHKHRAPALELAAQRACRFAIEPTFSIVVPVFRTPLDFLHEMVRSVLGQTYGKLELILVNASPEDVPLSAALEDYVRQDDRVRVVRLAENLGIVGNTYRGVDKATGDFVSFFDHDDVLEPDLLYHYVRGINDYPTTDLLYCDEDKLQDGVYLSPFFKPDWSPDLLMSNNYVCHLLTVRKAIVDELPREDLEAYEGSQDHHLTLFASERARNVYHARRVLYHWRMHAASTAANAQTKTYTQEAGVRAVQAHLDRCGIAATARLSGVAPNTYHVDYELAQKPLVSIIIPNKDMVPILDRCLASIRDKTTYPNYEIVIVENNSTDSKTFAYYDEACKRDERVRVVRQPSDGTFNFSKTINFGVEYAKGDYLLLLNNDTEVISADWIEQLMGPLTREEVGIVGAKLLFPDGLIQHAGVMLHGGTGPFHVSAHLPADSLHHYCSIQLTRNYSAVTGACLLTTRELFDEVGGLDEELAVDYNDIDFCFKVRAMGKLVVYEPEAMLMHYESISRGTHQTIPQRAGWYDHTGIMMHRWTRYFAAGDPYSNPNFAFNAYHQLDTASVLAGR